MHLEVGRHEGVVGHAIPSVTWDNVSGGEASCGQGRQPIMRADYWDCMR